MPLAQGFGYPRAHAVGRSIANPIVPPTMRARHGEGFDRRPKTGKSRVPGRRAALEAMWADGSICPAEIAMTEVRLPDRRISTAYLRDLAEAQKAAAEIQRQREALQRNEKLAAIGSLLAGVAHALNNPLRLSWSAP